MTNKESHGHEVEPGTTPIHVITDELDDVLTFCSCRKTAEEAVAILSEDHDDNAYYLRARTARTSAGNTDPTKVNGLWTVTNPLNESTEMYLDEAQADLEAADVNQEITRSGQPYLGRCRPVWHPLHHGAQVDSPPVHEAAGEAAHGA